VNAVRIVAPGALRALRQHPAMTSARTNAAQAIGGRVVVVVWVEGAVLSLLESAA